MTLKVRLAAMMILLLGAVLAAQYLLLQREQAALAARLEVLTDQIDQSTRLLTDRARQRVSADAAAFLGRGPGEGETLDADSTVVDVRIARSDTNVVIVMMHEDSLSTTGADGAPRRVRMEWTGPDALAELERELGGFADVIALDRDVEVSATDSTAVRRVTKSWTRRGAGGEAEERIQLMFVEASAESGG
ncbi:MAG: hypothetical protein HKN12_02090, partial [Gemmatimonadetes bacterium]|nr:hypothetical protein [Gemmatimonadota bacterium]